VHLLVDTAVQVADDAHHPWYLVAHCFRIKPVRLLAFLEHVFIGVCSVQRNSTRLNVYGTHAKLLELLLPVGSCFLDVLGRNGIESLHCLTEVFILQCQLLNGLLIVLLRVRELGLAAVYKVDQVKKVLQLSHSQRGDLLHRALDKYLGRVGLYHALRVVVNLIDFLHMYLRLLFFGLVIEEL
jgi:hypothetical protein